MNNDDRAERLRSRRGAAKEKAEQVGASEPSKASKGSEPSKTSKTSKQSEKGESGETSVKDELVGTYMYLPEDLKEDVNRYYKKLAGDYEFEFGEELEKNRHYYPLIVTHGFEVIRDADIEEIDEMVDKL